MQMKGFPFNQLTMIYLFSPKCVWHRRPKPRRRQPAKKKWMLKCNSKAILEIDVYAITLRNHQIYFYSFIIVNPSTLTLPSVLLWYITEEPEIKCWMEPLIHIPFLSLMTTDSCSKYEPEEDESTTNFPKSRKIYLLQNPIAAQRNINIRTGAREDE